MYYNFSFLLIGFFICWFYHWLIDSWLISWLIEWFNDYKVMPVARFPVAEINEASHRLLSSHQFPQRMIHMQVNYTKKSGSSFYLCFFDITQKWRSCFQRHVIRMVPVTQCFCDHKEKDLTYFVYGLESKVHAPDYPEQCCWGCSIM